MNKKLQTISYYLLLALIIFMPFQALFSNVLLAHSSLSASVTFWISHWYEPIILILLFLIIPSFRKGRKDKFVLIASVLLVTGVLVTLITQPFLRGIEGFRFTLSGILIFILIYLSDFSSFQKKKIVNTYLVVSLIVLLWALIEKFLPGRYWSLWGILPLDLVWGYGWHGVGNTLQVASFLGGPNQLASFLLPAFFIFGYRFIDADNRNKNRLFNTNLLLAVLCGAVIFLTFSRSAAIGLLFGLFLIPFLSSRGVWLKRGVVIVAIVCSVLIAVLYQQSNPIVTHGGSQLGHISALNISLDEIRNRSQSEPVKLFLGEGLGSAGPIILKYGDGLMPESWYLQLVFEIGLVGLALWLFLMILILKNLFVQRKLGLGLGLVSVLITALFLHTWADNPAMAYSLYILLGINLKKDN